MEFCCNTLDLFDLFMSYVINTLIPSYKKLYINEIAFTLKSCFKVLIIIKWVIVAIFKRSIITLKLPFVIQPAFPHK